VRFDRGVVRLVGYIVYNYCLRFDRGVVRLVGYIVYNYCLRFDRGVVRLVDYIVYNYCLKFKTNHSSVKPQTEIVDNITNRFSGKP
jgi:hypothetical protein